MTVQCDEIMYLVDSTLLSLLKCSGGNKSCIEMGHVITEGYQSNTAASL